MSLVSLPQTVRGLQRLRQIAQVLTKHGFGHFVERINLRRYLPLPGPAHAPRPHEPEADVLTSVGDRFVRVCEELGPTFVKIGQLASSRPDLVPAPVVKALTRLQDRVEPFDFDQARAILEADLGDSVETLFTRFDRAPIASGSMAQVHHAVDPDGRDVVVKIKRPGIDATVRLDMHVLAWLADGAETYIPELRLYRPRMIVDEFSQSMNRELDFMYEASATHRFAEAFAGSPAVHVPRVVWERTGANVLTMQRLSGLRMAEALEGRADGVHRRGLAKNLAECFLKQYFEMSLFHADPHPGNLLVYPPDQIGLIDFGMVGQVQDELTGQLVVALVATIQREVDCVIDVLADLGSIGPATDRARLRRELRELLEKYYGQPLRRLDLGVIFYELTDLMRRHDVVLPRDFVMLGKSLVAVAGVALQLDPELNLLELIRPRIKRMVSERLSSRRLLRGLLLGSWHIASALGELPRQLRDWMRGLSRGQMQIKIRHENLEHLASEIDRSSNRLSFSIFLAATIIGSSMLIRVPPADTVLGFSLRYFGFVGFAVSFVMGLGLLIAILRSGKLS
jgi:ubiquinone biosynthesis protein